MPRATTEATGVGLKIFGIVLIVAGFLLYAAAGEDRELTVPLTLPMWIGGALLYFRGRQYAAKARTAESASPISDSGPDVLYLRSFEADISTPLKILMSGFSTDEEQLAEALRPFGDLVAIGRPGESLPVPGAGRIYASDAEWKSVVLRRMRSAPLVVIRASSGTSLFWEIEQAFSLLNPERILVFVFNLAMKEYTGFADRIRDRTRVTLPAIGSFSGARAIVDLRENPSKALPGFISFSNDWRSEFHPLPLPVIRFYKPWKKPFSVALRPIFARHGISSLLDAGNA